MRTFSVASIVAAALVVGTSPVTSQGRERGSDSLERSFNNGGRVRMDLAAGEYMITGSSANQVRVEWSVRDADRLWRAKARADVRGSLATIETDGPSNGGLRADIRVPLKSDLDIRLSAGELTVEGVEGNKEIDLYAGEIDLDVGPPTDYRTVEASVWAGEISARPFGISKEGLFRSVDWRGSGAYRIRVKLWAGEIRLYSSSPASR